MGAKFQKEIAKKIGKKIKACRVEKRLSQEELAKKVGVGASQISKWESGAQIPRADKLLELDSVLNLIARILAEYEKPSYEEESTDELVPGEMNKQIKYLQEEVSLLRKEINEIKSHTHAVASK